jgi:hypothetical protein
MNKYLPPKASFCILTRLDRKDPDRPVLITSVRGAFHHWVFIIPFIMISLAVGLVNSYHPDTIIALTTGYLSILLILIAIWFLTKAIPRIKYSGSIIMEKCSRQLINKGICKLSFKNVNLPEHCILVSDEYIKTMDNKHTGSKMHFSTYRLYAIPMSSLGVDRPSQPSPEGIMEKIVEMTDRLSILDSNEFDASGIDGVTLLYKGERYDLVYRMAESISKVYDAPYVDLMTGEEAYHAPGEEPPTLIEKMKADDEHYKKLEGEYSKFEQEDFSGVKTYREQESELKMRFSGGIVGKVVSALLLIVFTITGLLAIYPVEHGYLFMIIPVVFLMLIYYRRTWLSITDKGAVMRRWLSAVPLAKEKHIPLKELKELLPMGKTLVFFGKDGGIITTVSNKETAYLSMLKIKLWISENVLS